MKPRYKISQKWTAFPAEFSAQIKDLFTHNFAKYLENSIKVFVDGRIFTKEIALRVGLHTQGELKRFNFEASVDLPENQTESNEKLIFDKISLMVDAIGTLMTEYFENEQDIELPYVWAEVDFSGKKVWIQHSTENPDLEAQADALLGLDTESKVIHNADDEKSEDVLDTTEDEFDQFAEQVSEHIHSEPQMFKKKKKDDLH
ncbi:MAG: hypothetical protein ACK4VO_07675 [Pseudobdellovibrio sp.]